jgi:putative spermidine/putrescine transport system ATP-binding protein
MARVALDGVWKIYEQRGRKVEAVRDLTLDCADGEFLAIVGPSGCGKSSTMRMIAGLEAVSRGTITIGERVINNVKPADRNIAMVFENYALYPHLTVRENIVLSLEVRGVSKPEIERLLHRAVATLDIGDILKRKPRQLSGGQKQRVAIARAIVLEPRLVLMDEPLSNLDAALRLEMRTEIRRLHQSLDLTTVYVTHDQEEALALADRLVVLRDGEVQQVGSPEEVYAHPRIRYVAGFMGYRNLLPVTVLDSDGDTVTVAADGIELVGVNRDGLTPGAEAVAAVRPADFTVSSDGNAVRAQVEVVEYHGREQAVEARLTGGQRLHVRVESRLAPGDTVQLRVSPERVLVFAA